MWCLRMGGLMGEGFKDSSLKPHILKHHIPEHPIICLRRYSEDLQVSMIAAIMRHHVSNDAPLLPTTSGILETTLSTES